MQLGVAPPYAPFPCNGGMQIPALPPCPRVTDFALTRVGRGPSKPEAHRETGITKKNFRLGNPPNGSTFRPPCAGWWSGPRHSRYLMMSEDPSPDIRRMPELQRDFCFGSASRGGTRS
jgi:hypothetical protein